MMGSVVNGSASSSSLQFTSNLKESKSPPTEDQLAVPLTQLLQQVLAVMRPPARAISDETVAEMMGISTSAVWALCTPGTPTYDESFPKPKRYRTLRRTVWNRGRVQAYLDDLFADEEIATFSWPPATTSTAPESKRSTGGGASAKIRRQRTASGSKP